MAMPTNMTPARVAQNMHAFANSITGRAADAEAIHSAPSQFWNKLSRACMFGKPSQVCLAHRAVTFDVGEGPQEIPTRQGRLDPAYNSFRGGV